MRYSEGSFEILGGHPGRVALAGVAAVVLGVTAADGGTGADELRRWVTGGGAIVQSVSGSGAVVGTIGQSAIGRQSTGAGQANLGFWTPRGEVVDVAGGPLDVPLVTRLHANAPNPFNPRTTFRFDLSSRGRAVIRVFDVNGRVVDTVVDAVLEAGRHSVGYSATDLASGVYFYELRHDAAREVRQFTLLK